MQANLNPIAFRKTKLAYNVGLSECNMVKTLLTDSKLHTTQS